MIPSDTEPMVVQGRVLFGADIERIRGLIRSHPEWTRRRLSIELCELWDWCSPAGHTKDMSCRNLLLKLHRQGLIDLPAPTRRPPQLNGRIERIFDLDETVVDCPLSDLGPLSLVTVHDDVDRRRLFQYLLRQHHYRDLIEQLRLAMVVDADETGWRIGTLNAWLWVFTNQDTTVYLIRSGEGARGHQAIIEILGENFAGVLVSDCFSAYLKQQKAQIAPEDYRRKCARLEDKLDDILHNYAAIEDEDAARFVARLAKQRRHLFTFLYHDAVPPTNNHAERMIRPEVVARKTQGCNKSKPGADAHAILGSILVTEKQRGRSPVNRLAQLVRQRAGPIRTGAATVPITPLAR